LDVAQPFVDKVQSPRVHRPVSDGTCRVVHRTIRGASAAEILGCMLIVHLQRTVRLVRKGHRSETVSSALLDLCDIKPAQMMVARGDVVHECAAPLQVVNRSSSSV
jgi:hypothetical protein